MYLIGVTQRVTIDPRTGEKRDSLAQDWRRFFSALGLPWIALPNSAADAVGLAKFLNISGLLLTGGDDIGVFPERDGAELALLNFAAKRSLPVVGVCRGFQMIQHRLGGVIAPVSAELHRAARHELRFAGGAARTVNSYHMLAPSPLAAPLSPLAVCRADGTVEAARNGPQLGIMWHPEREAVPHMDDLRLIYGHFTGMAF